MKILILMRHAQAELYAETDATRPLTPYGRQKATALAQALAQTGLKPQLLLCSPLLRARQTAHIVEETLQTVVQIRADLDGRLSAKGLADLALELMQTYDCVMLVGHNPNISLAARLLSGTYISFAAGACAAFDVTDDKRPKLIFLENK